MLGLLLLYTSQCCYYNKKEHSNASFSNENNRIFNDVATTLCEVATKKSQKPMCILLYILHIYEIYFLNINFITCATHFLIVTFYFYAGEGMSELSLADRATIANMSPEYGATMGFFPVDHVTLQYLKLTGRKDETVSQCLY